MADLPNSVSNPANSAPVIRVSDPARAAIADQKIIASAFQRVLSSGWFILGPENEALEQELATAASVAYAVVVGSGTAALEIALAAVGVGAGRPVYTAANAGGYAAAAARSLGAPVVFVDVDPDSLLMTTDTLQEAVTAEGISPAAVVVTHLFGASADVAALVDWCRPRGIMVIEDTAQAFGGMLADRPLGSMGDVAITSFYPTKNLGAIGDGGAILTSQPEVAAKARQLRQYGWEQKYVVTDPRGRNSRMDEFQAAVVRERLALLPTLTARRRAVHQAYEDATDAMVNRVASGFVAHLAVLRSGDRAAVREHLQGKGISTDVHYPVPDHLQPIERPRRVLVHAERAAAEILTVPLFPHMTDEEVDRVATALRSL